MHMLTKSLALEVRDPTHLFLFPKTAGECCQSSPHGAMEDIDLISCSSYPSVLTSTLEKYCCEQLAEECPHVTVNSISPGVMETRMNEKFA